MAKFLLREPSMLGQAIPGEIWITNQMIWKPTLDGLASRTMMRSGIYISAPSPPAGSHAKGKWTRITPIVLEATSWFDPYNNVSHSFPIIGGYRRENVRLAAFYVDVDKSRLAPPYARGEVFVWLQGPPFPVFPTYLDYEYVFLMGANSAGVQLVATPRWQRLYSVMDDQDLINVNNDLHLNLPAGGSIGNDERHKIAGITWVLYKAEGD